MPKRQKISNAQLMYQAFLYGIAACGFLVIACDMLLRIPGLNLLIEPIASRFFPEVTDGLGLLISSLVFFGLGALPSAFGSKSSADAAWLRVRILAVLGRQNRSHIPQ